MSAVASTILIMPWYVVQTHQKKESVADKNISNQGFETFLPTCVEQTIRRGEKRERTQPLFPGYMFVEFDPDQDRWFSILHTYGVKRLFSVIPVTKDKDYSYIRPLSIPTSIITSLKKQVVPDPSPIKQVIARGTRLRITKGHFEGREGICQMSSTKRVILLMQVMNGELEVSFTADSVELIQ